MKNKSFQNFSKNWQKQNGQIIFINLVISFLKAGAILPFFQSKENVPVLKHSSKILRNGLQIDLPQILYHTDIDGILTMGLIWI